MGAVVFFNQLMAFASLLRPVVDTYEVPFYLFSVIQIPGVYAVVYMFRKIAVDNAHSKEDLENFRIKDAICAVERDRPVVEGNVVYLMKTLKQVPTDCTRVDALAFFDHLVQRNMPRVIRASIGRAGVRYECAVMCVSPYLFALFDTVGGQIHSGHGTLAMISSIIEWSTWIFATLPLCMALCMWLCSYCKDLVGFKESAFVALVAFSGYLVSIVLYWTLMTLQTKVEDGKVFFGALCLVSTVLFALTFLIFRRSPGKSRKRRRGTVSESTEDLAAALTRFNDQESTF